MFNGSLFKIVVEVAGAEEVDMGWMYVKIILYKIKKRTFYNMQI